jgi:hypothetical protein
MTKQSDIENRLESATIQLKEQAQRFHDHNIGLEARIATLEANNRHIMDFITEKKATARTLLTGLIITGFGGLFTAFVAFLFKHL